MMLVCMGTWSAVALGQSATGPASEPATNAATMAGAPRAPMTKAAILKIVEAERRGIETLAVEFRFDSNESGDERARYSARVVMRGHDVVGPGAGGDVRQMMVDRAYGPSDDRLFHQWIAFNGQFTCWYQAYNHLGGLLPGLVPNADVRGEGFFQLNMLADPWKKADVRGEGSLTGFLRNQFTVVMPRMEKVDGAGGGWCYVLTNGGFFHTDARIWLDPERGFLPVRQRYFGERREVTEWDVEKAELIGGKFWMATSGREVLPDGAVVKMVVGRDEKNGAKIKVNEVLAGDYFDLWKQMPAGTRVFNAQANRTLVVGEHGELKDLAEGKDVGGEEVSPDAQGLAVGSGFRVGKIGVILAWPVGFLVVSLCAMLVVGWVGMRRVRNQ